MFKVDTLIELSSFLSVFFFPACSGYLEKKDDRAVERNPHKTCADRS